MAYIYALVASIECSCCHLTCTTRKGRDIPEPTEIISEVERARGVRRRSGASEHIPWHRGFALRLCQSADSKLYVCPLILQHLLGFQGMQVQISLPLQTQG